MSKLSENQTAALKGLHAATTDRKVEWVTKAVWKQFCDPGVSVNTDAILKTGAVVAVRAGVSVNGKLTELYRPA